MKSILTNPIKKKQYLLIAVDSIIIFSALLLSYFFRLGVYEGKELWVVGERLSWITLPVIFINILVFYVFELYKIEKRFLKLRCLLTITLAVSLAFGILIAFFYFFPEYRLGRVVLTTYIPIVASGLFFWRLSFFKILQKERGHNNLLLIGGDAEIRLLIEELQKYPIREYSLSGIIYEDENTPGKTMGGIPVISKDENIEKFVREKNIKTIVISSNHGPPENLIKSALDLKFKGVAIYDMANFYKDLTGKVPIFHIKDLWLLFSAGIGAFGHPYYKRVKRLMDFFFSIFFLFITSPILVFCIIAIKLESKGPVFFKQERLGINQKPFHLIKFRTMIHNAEEKTGPIRAKYNDSRVTRIGKFFRKTRLDEIPQFINILKGDMSFIGPRPIRKYFSDKYSKEIGYYPLRFSVKPGLTGWAQTRFGYSESDEDQIEKFQYDLFYIQEASLFLDLLISMKTFQTVLFRPSQ